MFVDDSAFLLDENLLKFYVEFHLWICMYSWCFFWGWIVKSPPFITLHHFCRFLALLSDEGLWWVILSYCACNYLCVRCLWLWYEGWRVFSFRISNFQFLRFYLCLCCVILSFVALDYNYVPTEELLDKEEEGVYSSLFYQKVVSLHADVLYFFSELNKIIELCIYNER